MNNECVIVMGLKRNYSIGWCNLFLSYFRLRVSRRNIHLSSWLSIIDVIFDK